MYEAKQQGRDRVAAVLPRAARPDDRPAETVPLPVEPAPVDTGPVPESPASDVA
jgi:hypothetical protein